MLHSLYKLLSCKSADNWEYKQSTLGKLHLEETGGSLQQSLDKKMIYYRSLPIIAHGTALLRLNAVSE